MNNGSKRYIRLSAAAIIAVAICSGCSDKKVSTYQGYVEGEFVYVAPSQSGRLDRLSVQRGQQVALNAPLFVLESEDEAAAQRQARQQLAAAEAQYDDLKSGKRAPELDVTRAQLAQAVAEEKKAATQLERDEAQFKAGGIAKAQLDESRAAAETSSAHARELKNQLEVGALPARPAQQKAQAAQIAAARAALEQASWKLGQKAVTAPRAGLVLDTLYREGEWVQAGNPIVRMLPPQNVKARFFVPQTTLGALAIGGPVSLHCDGCAANFNAKITYISSEAEYTPPVIYSNESRSKLVYMVEARPDVDQALKLHPGQPLEVTLK